MAVLILGFSFYPFFQMLQYSVFTIIPHILQNVKEERKKINPGYSKLYEPVLDR